MIVDLHSHTTYSDGTKTVPELLTLAEEKKIQVFAITDHDTIDGCLEATKHQELYQGIFINGAELSTRNRGKSVHLLAYFPDLSLLQKSKLQILFNKLEESRLTRMQKMVEKAQCMNFDITFQDVIQEARQSSSAESNHLGKILARPHLARVMVKKGYVNSMQEAFDKYLNEGKPLYEPKFRITPQQWVDAVKEVNGIISWAHPLLHIESLQELELFANDLLQIGIHGIELRYKYNVKYYVPKDLEVPGIKFLKEFVLKHDLLVTAGGDYHGDSGVLGELELSRVEVDKFLHELGS